MKTLILKIEYDGTNYSGWQRQANSNSIQEEIEESLIKLFQKEVKITGAGRTDAGVHSSGQIATANFEDLKKLQPINITKGLNSYLPKDIRILGTSIINKDLNARFDAIAREYSYYISIQEQAIKRNYISSIRFPLDLDILFQSAELFIGKYDFTTYSKLNLDTKNYVCNVEKSNWVKLDNKVFRFQIKANRFVYGMVRSIVGTMLFAARNKISLEDIRENLIKKDRQLNAPLVEAKGLILEKIYFEDEIKFD